MKKGHYGHYTGNARHSRKEEMIHDRELIYDAKTQIHHEDEKYKHTGKSGYKQDMIHERELIHDTKTQLHHADSDYKGDSPAHLTYSSRFGGMSLKDPVSTGAYTNFDGGAYGDVSAIRQRDKALSDMAKNASNTVKTLADEKKKKDAVKKAKEKEDNKTQTYKTKGMEIDPISLTKFNIPPVDTSFVKDSKTTVEVSVKTPTNVGGGGKLSSYDTAWEKDYDNIRTSGMYGGTGDKAKQAYIKDQRSQGETKNKANARNFAKSILGKNEEYNPNTMKDRKNRFINGF